MTDQLTAGQRLMVQDLADALQSDRVPARMDLTRARVLPGWWIQVKLPRQGRRKVYEVWAPWDRSPLVPWSLGPCHHQGGRKWLIKFLREGWLDDARGHLGDLP